MSLYGKKYRFDFLRIYDLWVIGIFIMLKNFAGSHDYQ